MHSASSTSNSPLPMDFAGQQKQIEQQIDKSLQNQEISKVRHNFQGQLRDCYMARKSKEYLTLHCAQHCFNKDRAQLVEEGTADGQNRVYYQDEMTRMEKACMISCFHKSFRYLAHANSIYTLLTSDSKAQKDILEQYKDQNEEPTFEESIAAATR